MPGTSPSALSRLVTVLPVPVLGMTSMLSPLRSANHRIRRQNVGQSECWTEAISIGEVEVTYREA